MTADIIKTILTEREKDFWEYVKAEAARLCTEQYETYGATSEDIASLYTALEKFNKIDHDPSPETDE